MSLYENHTREELLQRIDQLSSLLSNRDRDWVLAIADALGDDRGYNVPVVPIAAPFRQLFKEIRERAISKPAEPEPESNALPVAGVPYLTWRVYCPIEIANAVADGWEYVCTVPDPDVDTPVTILRRPRPAGAQTKNDGAG